MPESSSSPEAQKDRFWLRVIYILSTVVSAAVAFLILGPRPEGSGGLDVSALPLVNSSLNSLTGILLFSAWIAIKKKRISVHKTLMLSAFGTSIAFLCSYIIYHWYKAGPKQYTGDYREIYLFILISHIILAALIIPLALVTLYRGWNMDIPKHRKIAKVTLPLWLYVSVTGVVIYAMLYM
jgi:putative membrane protein